jgi:hypothetical protein
MRISSRAPGQFSLLVLAALCAAGTARGQLAGFSAIEGTAVTTADRTDVSRLTDAGVVTVGEGAGAAVITLAGEMKGRAERDGVIGLILVPELPFFTSAYRNRKAVLAAAEVTAPVAAGETGLFMAKSKRIEVGFSSYHLYLYDTTGAPATVNVYVYPARN